MNAAIVLMAIVLLAGWFVSMLWVCHEHDKTCREADEDNIP